jgi:hypothetical protein
MGELHRTQKPQKDIRGAAPPTHLHSQPIRQELVAWRIRTEQAFLLIALEASITPVVVDRAFGAYHRILGDHVVPAVDGFMNDGGQQIHLSIDRRWLHLFEARYRNERAGICGLGPLIVGKRAGEVRAMFDGDDELGLIDGARHHRAQQGTTKHH